MKKKILLLTFFALLLSGCGQEVITVAGIRTQEGQESGYIEMKEFRLKEPEQESGREEVSCCAVMIPMGYHESEEIPGMYIHERSPLDSSNVYYTVSEGGGEGRVSAELTKEKYRKLLEEAYRQGGQAVQVEIESFERIDMEGIPGYKVRSACQVGDGRMEQLAYLILGEDTYTITYSQMSDDELMADFEISDGEIRLVREEEVSLAQGTD